MQLPGYLVDYTDEYLAVFNTEQTPLETIELDVGLLPGCSLKMGCAKTAALKLRLHRTHRIDIVCPRKIAGVHFGSEQEYTPRRDIHGVAPDQARRGGQTSGQDTPLFIATRTTASKTS